MSNGTFPVMRRSDRAVENLPDILAILEQCVVMRLAMTGPDGPYIVPVNFGYLLHSDQRLTLYFHGALQGRKRDMLDADPRVCFEVDCEHRLIAKEAACGYSYGYASAIGFGKARRLTESMEKAQGLSCLMARFDPAPSFVLDMEAMEKTAVYAIDVEHITGKRH